MNRISAKGGGRNGRDRPCAEWQQCLNDRTSLRKLETTLAANFRLDDLFVTLTYSEQNLPPNYNEAAKILRRFFSRYRKERHALGLKHDYVYVIEGEHGDKRMHHHLVCSGGNGNILLIRRLWTLGEIQAETIRAFSTRTTRDKPSMNLGEYIRKYGVAEGSARFEHDCWSKIASYMTKEPRKTGRVRWQARMFTPSRGLRKPEIVIRELSPGRRFEPPDNVIVLDCNRSDNEYGNFSYVVGWAKNRTSR